MSDLSPWLQSHGFRDDPFGYFTAEEASVAGLLQETYIYDEQLERLMLDAHRSVAFLVPYGGGKTAARRYLHYRWQRSKRNTLIAIYNDFEQVASALPTLSLRSHVSALIGSIAKPVWDFFMQNTAKFLNLSDQEWWWSLLDVYLPGEPLRFRIARAKALQESYRNYRKDKGIPFRESESLAHILQTILDRLSDIGFQNLLILVDEVDGHERNQQPDMEKVVQPLLNSPKLFSDRITWKFFLPEELENTVKRSSASRKRRLQLHKIQWNEANLQEFLSKRLDWTSEGKTPSLGMLSEENPDLDKELIELTQKNQDRLGSPRTLLTLGQRMVLELETRGDALISRSGWHQFFKSIPDLGLQSDTNIQSDEPGGQNEFKWDSLSELREDLCTNFTDSELRNLAFDLSIDYEDLPGETKSDKARELIGYCVRRNLLVKLVARVRYLRPNIPERRYMREYS